jgi:hypothetical protein
MTNSRPRILRRPEEASFRCERGPDDALLWELTRTAERTIFYLSITMRGSVKPQDGMGIHPPPPPGEPIAGWEKWSLICWCFPPHPLFPALPATTYWTDSARGRPSRSRSQLTVYCMYSYSSVDAKYCPVTVLLPSYSRQYSTALPPTLGKSIGGTVLRSTVPTNSHLLVSRSSTDLTHVGP